jgi:ATP synthase protein I
VLKAAVPGSVTETTVRGVLASGFDDEPEDPPVKALTRAEAQALRLSRPQLSPWRVIAAQVVVGGVLGGVAWLVWGRSDLTQSVLYGVFVAVLPGVLMARGMTSRLTGLSVASSAAGVMVWSLVKICVSICALLLAPKLIQPLNWPCLLGSMTLCMQVYWVALLWPGR